MSLTRQQRRSALRQALAAGEQTLMRGLGRAPERTEILAAALALGTRLNAGSPGARIAAFSAALLGLYEKSSKAAPTKLALACKKGCNWCCHTFVSASVPEILHMATAAGVLAPDRLARADAAAALGPAERLGRKVPCPLLDDAGCARYAARPVMCRVATSLDVASCIDEYEGRDLRADIAVAKSPIQHGFNTRAVVMTALAIHELDGAAYDLAGGLREAQDADAVAARWLAGERAFISVHVAPVDGELKRLAEALAAEGRALAS